MFRAIVVHILGLIPKLCMLTIAAGETNNTLSMTEDFLPWHLDSIKINLNEKKLFKFRIWLSSWFTLLLRIPSSEPALKLLSKWNTCSKCNHLCFMGRIVQGLCIWYYALCTKSRFLGWESRVSRSPRWSWELCPSGSPPRLWAGQFQKSKPCR